MSNEITEDGLVTATSQELIDQYTAGMKAIYGPDINLEQDTPDGQQMMLIVQIVLDNLDLLRSIYNSFDPDSAIGATLDKRIAFNGIQRQGGTFSITNITIVTDRALTLSGINDTSIDDAFRVADDAGTEWALVDELVFAGANTQAVAFRSVLAGKVLTTINTITTPVTIILGVGSVNNPAAQTIIGIDEETDKVVKVRRGLSVSRASQGYLPSLRAELENINDIGSVKTYENNTAATDADGIPAHSLWVIVSGTATDSEIATAIYKKRSAGCNMRGLITFEYEEIDGKLFTVAWDTVVPEPLHIEFTVESQDGINPPLTAEIANGLPAILTYDIGSKANTNDLVAAIRSIDPNALVTLEGMSPDGGGPFTTTVTPTGLEYQLQVSTANIDITEI